MARRILNGMRVRLMSGPAAGITGTVVKDMDGRDVRWDGGTITIPEGLVTHHGEQVLQRIEDEDGYENIYDSPKWRP